MKKLMLLVLFVFATAGIAMAADDEAALKDQMKKDCAPLFADGAACSNLAKGSRKCVRQNIDKGGAACVAFEKEHKAFFDAGMKDDIVKK
jgi:hypothetical protein